MQDQSLEGYRLSPQQERLWALGRASCPTHCTVSLEGALDLGTLRAALQRMVDRHEILRTSFRRPAGADVVLQRITPEVAASLTQVDLSALEQPLQDEEVARRLQEDQARAFELEQGLGLRAQVLRLAEERHLLLLGAPGISVDAASMSRLLTALMAAYAELRGGPPSPRVAVVQDAEFAQRQNALWQSEAGREGQADGKQSRGAGSRVVRLPFEKEPTVHSQASLDWTLEADPLDALAEREHLPATSILLACWEALLWRMTGQPDELVMEALFDGRDHAPRPSALGCFGQYMPLRTRLTDTTPLLELARQVADATREASRRSDWAAGGASLHRLGFSSYAWPAPGRAEGLTFAVRDLRACGERLKLELVCAREGARWRLSLRHDSSVYSLESIERLRDAWRVLVEHAVRAPSCEIGALSLLDDRARLEVLVRWNLAPRDESPRGCLQERFEAQAARTPEALAVTYEGTDLTYRQLNERANQLAHHLQGLGVGPDTVVGLLLERSERMIIGLLGILKAGGAYLPVEPSLPKERLRLLLKEAGADFLVTEGQLARQLPTEFTAVRLDADAHQIGQLSRKNVHSGVGEKNLAYVIFTSGSTGTPKGVAIEHRQLLDYVSGVIERLDLRDIASFATVSTLGADLGNTSIFPSLCLGGRLHVLSQERASDAAALAESLARHPCDLLKIVPSHLAALVSAAPRPGSVLPRKRLVLGGESLTWDTLRLFQSHAPDCRIFNHYGPTETTVGVACGPAPTHATPGLSASVPLGHALAHACFYVLDARGQPVPLGVAGEVFIGGTTLARGYLHRPELTADRFVPDPFSERPGARMYRTGDRARYLPDGAIEFLGRVDRQVTLRGFRIELGEVESVLRRHEAVRESVVVLQGESGAQRLDAYVVAEPARAPTSEQLRSFLKETLPEYMVPTHIVLLERLPLTPNGKIDERALPAPRA
jgi:amino acid adenylation domain-containing protein